MSASSDYRIVVPAPANFDQWQIVEGSEKPLGSQHGLKLVVRTFKDPAGKPDDFTVCRKAPGVTICPVTPDGKLVMVNQFKQGIAQLVLEFPAGMKVKPGDETFEQLALQELAEETGYEAESIQPLCGSPSSPAPRKIDTKEYLFIALGAQHVGSQKLDKGEHAIEVVELSPATFVHLREQGKIISTFTREAFGLALEKGYIKL